METENKNVVFLAMEVLKQLKEFGLARPRLKNKSCTNRKDYVK